MEDLKARYHDEKRIIKDILKVGLHYNFIYSTVLLQFKGLNMIPYMLQAKNNLFHCLVFLFKLCSFKWAVGKIRSLMVTR